MRDLVETEGLLVEVCVIGPPDGCEEELHSYVESLLDPCVC